MIQSCVLNTVKRLEMKTLKVVVSFCRYMQQMLADKHKNIEHKEFYEADKHKA